MVHSPDTSQMTNSSQWDMYVSGDLYAWIHQTEISPV